MLRWSQMTQVAFIVALTLALAITHASTQADSIPASWSEDADLRDVHFADRQYGWAVGDLGTVWHTQDGGEVWRRQETPVDCQLSTVHFVDRKTGYAAGGKVVPITHRSKCVLLKTTDGGKTWEQVSGLLLPWVTRLHFSDARNGLAVGMATAIHPSGVWKTGDGGKTWNPIRGVAGSHWSDAAFVGDAAMLVSRDGQGASLSGGRLHPLQFPTPSAFATDRCTAMLNAQFAFVAGTRLAATGDAGQSWQTLGNVGPSFESRSIATTENGIWQAGSPGTRIVHSSDLGGTWLAAKSPVTLPLHRIRFQESGTVGWAVGSRGTILGSKDGGATWQQKRGGAKRVALLGVFADEQSIPWEVLAEASTKDEWRVHIVVLAARHKAAANVFECDLQHRLQAAAAEIGATAELLTNLSYPDSATDVTASELLAYWNGVSANVTQDLSERIAQRLRVYRPDVVLDSEANAENGATTGAQRFLNQLVANACEYASKLDVFPQQIKLGLQPWKVTRHVTTKKTEGLPASLDSIASVRGDSVASLASRARRLVRRTPASRFAWSLFGLDDNGTVRNVGRYPLSGLGTAYDTAQRRPRTIHSINVAARTKAIQRQAQTRRMLSAEKVVGRGQNRLQQIERLLPDSNVAAELMFELANRQAVADPAEAEEIYRHLISKHSTHPLAEPSLMWLVRWHTSIERKWRRERKEIVPKPEPGVRVDPAVQQASAEVPVQEDATLALPLDDEEAALLKSLDEMEARGELGFLAELDALDSLDALGGPSNNGNPQADPDGTAVPNESLAPFSPRLETALQLARQVKTKRPDLYGEPRVAFPFASALRLDGQTKAAEGFYRRLGSLPSRSLWRATASYELNDVLGRSLESSTAWVCPRVESRPHLDGQFDEDCWLSAPVVELTNRKGLPPTQLKMAHDERYLYIAAACPKRAGARYLPARRPRPRDANLSKMDRLQFAIDVNRDYSSWWSLEVDHRGWTNESLLGDVSWNPQYFVASHDDEEAWTVEVAIPLDELGPEGFRDGHWAIGVRRLVPEIATESWQPGMSADSLGVQGILSLE